jgi:hypothetical protein
MGGKRTFGHRVQRLTGFTYSQLYAANHGPMEARLRRRAERNFGVLIKRLGSVVVVALVPIAALAKLAAWSTWSPGFWLLAGCSICLLTAALGESLDQLRKLVELAPLREAGRLWLASVKRSISRKRRRGSSALWELLLAVVFGSPLLLAVRPAPIDLIGQYRPVSIFPAILVYLVCVPLLTTAVRRAQVDLGGRAPVCLAAALAVIPAFWVVLLEGKWQETQTFGAGPVAQETVVATVSGRCSTGSGRPAGTYYCASAATSRGPVHWPTLLNREAWLVYRLKSRACARVRLERAIDGTFRLAGGVRRIDGRDVVPCPANDVRLGL